MEEEKQMTQEDLADMQMDAFEKNASIIQIPDALMPILRDTLSLNGLRAIEMNGSRCGFRLLDEHVGQLALCIQQSNLLLEALALTYHNLTDESLEYISDALLTPREDEVRTLEHLDLEGNNLTFKGLKFLKLNSSKHCPLISLNLSGNSLQQEGGLAMAEALITNKTIRGIRVNNCGLPLTAVVAISQALCSSAPQVSLSLSLNGIFLYTGGVVFNVECCIR